MRAQRCEASRQVPAIAFAQQCVHRAHHSSTLTSEQRVTGANAVRVPQAQIFVYDIYMKINIDHVLFCSAVCTFIPVHLKISIVPLCPIGIYNILYIYTLY